MEVAPGLLKLRPSSSQKSSFRTEPEYSNFHYTCTTKISRSCRGLFKIANSRCRVPAIGRFFHAFLTSLEPSKKPLRPNFYNLSKFIFKSAVQPKSESSFLFLARNKVGSYVHFPIHNKYRSHVLLCMSIHVGGTCGNHNCQQ